MHAYATKTESAADKSVMKEEQQGTYPEFSGIINLAGGGRSLDLPNTLRSRVRSQFGLNMDSLQIKESAQVADFGANAMAQGNIISFAPGLFNPNTSSGRELIGHELHHITEQARGTGSNVEGSNIHYNPVSESASDAAGRIFASSSIDSISSLSAGADSAPSVTPAAAASAPVQGDFKFSDIFSIFRKKRPQQNNKMPEDQSEPKPDELAIVPDQSEAGSKPVSKPDNKPDDGGASDKEVYDIEKHFLPSPDSGVFKKMAFEKSMNTAIIPHMLRSTLSAIERREASQVYRGMSKDSLTNQKETDDKKLNDSEIDNYKNYFAQDGNNADLFKKVDAGNGISNDIQLTYHADVKNKDFSKLKNERIFREYTAFARPKLAFFWLKNFLSGKKDRSRLFNDKIKRSVILDTMQSRDDVKKSGFSRNALKVIYEKIHNERKQEENETDNTFNTGLDADPGWLPTPDGPEEKKKQEDIAHAMKGISVMDSGHAWIETESKDKAGAERVRFTMGFVPEENTSKNPFELIPGMVINPDIKDRNSGNYSKSRTINKSEYIKALKFAKDFRAKYSLSGLGGANCTSFATDVAKTAGLDVKSSERTLKGNVHSPDSAVKDLTVIPENEQTMFKGGYKEFEIPKEADIDDSKVSHLLLEACRMTQKYKSIISGHTNREIAEKEFILTDKLLSEFQNLFDLNRAYMLRALHKFKSSYDLPGDSDILTVFVEDVLEKAEPSLTSDEEAKTIFNESRKEKLSNFMFDNCYKDLVQPNNVDPTAVSLLPYFNDNKETLQAELINAKMLQEKWFDSGYADKIARAFAIAVETHLLKSDDLDLKKLYMTHMKKSSMDVVKFVKKFKFLKSRNAVISELDSILNKYEQDGDEADELYNEMYFSG